MSTEHAANLFALAASAEECLLEAESTIEGLLAAMKAVGAPAPGDARLDPTVLARIAAVTLRARLCNDMMGTALRGIGAVAHDVGGAAALARVTSQLQRGVAATELGAKASVRSGS
jgi:hypothetical protein